MNIPDTLPGAPDIAPRPHASRTEVRGGFVRRGQIVGIETGGGDARLQVVAVYAAKERRVYDVFGGGVDDHFLVAWIGVGLAARDKARAYVRQIRPESLRGNDATARRDRAG